jgi:hypothetical protein
MTQAYVISPAEAGRMLVVGPYADRVIAAAYVGPSGHVVGHAADVIWTGQVLVEVYNMLAERPVKKFESRDVGVKRLLSVLPAVARAPAPVQPATTEKEIKMSETNGRGRAPAIAGDAKIKVLAEKNPKRAGTASFDRFAKYADGQTVDEFIAAGGLRADVNYDADKGYISVG